MEDQHYAKMESVSSVVAPERPRRTVRLQPIQRSSAGHLGNADGPQPPSAPPPELGQLWGVVPPLFPQDRPPPPYGAPGKETLERVGLAGPKPGANRHDEEERLRREIAANNRQDSMSGSEPPPAAMGEGRDRQEPEDEDREPCCAAGCCGNLSADDENAVGPMTKPRKCRDVFCLAFLLLVWAGWIAMLWVTLTEGCPENCNDPRKLVFGTDSATGEVCGTGSQAGKHRVYFAFPANPLSRRFCVSECPSSFSGDVSASTALGLYEGDVSKIKSAADNCLLTHAVGGALSVVLSEDGASEHGNETQSCFYPTYATADLLFKCVPLLPHNLSEGVALGFPSSAQSFAVASKFIAAPAGWLGSAVSELQVTWRVVAMACGVSVLLGFLWLLLLRQFALCTLVSFALLLLSAAVALSLLAWDKAGVVSVASVAGELDESLDAVQMSSTVAKMVATAVSAVTVVLLLLALCLARRVLLAVRLIQEASQALLDMPSLLLLPISTLLSTTLLAALALTGGLFLASAGEYDPVLGAYSYASTAALRDSACVDQLQASNPLPSARGAYHMSAAEAERWCVVFRGDAAEAEEGWRVSVEATAAGGPRVNLTAAAGGPASMTVKQWLGGGFREELPFQVSDYYNYMWLYHILTMLWAYCFTTTCMAMVVGGSVGLWFWRAEGSGAPRLAVLRSWLRVACYHLGTAALGSLIVALVWFARLLVQFLLKKLRLCSGSRLGGVFGCLLDCCLACVQRFVKFVNRNTVIVAALHGESYCYAARKAMRLLLANVLRVAAVSTTSLMLLFLGKLFVVAAATAGTWAWIRYDPLDQQLNLASKTPIATLVVVAALSWGIARLFMSVHWVVIEALLLCLFEDSESDAPLSKTCAIEGRLLRSKILVDDPQQPPPRDATNPRRSSARRTI